jgi:hypothetical protein
MMLWDVLIHSINKQKIRFARLDACCQQPDPKRACVKRFEDSAIFGANKVPRLAFLYSVHEGVRNDYCVV